MGAHFTTIPGGSSAVTLSTTTTTTTASTTPEITDKPAASHHRRIRNDTSYRSLRCGECRVYSISCIYFISSDVLVDPITPWYRFDLGIA